MILPPTHHTRLFSQSPIFFSFHSSSSFFLFLLSFFSIHSILPSPPHSHHNALLPEDQPLKDRRQGHHSLGNTSYPCFFSLLLFSYSFSLLCHGNYPTINNNNNIDASTTRTNLTSTTSTPSWIAIPGSWIQRCIRIWIFISHGQRITSYWTTG